MSTITDKDIISIVRDKLIDQGAKSMDDDTLCRYRGHKDSTIDEIRQHVKSQFSDEESYWFTFNDVLSETRFDAKCAVGHLIDDKFYSSTIEGTALDEDIFELVIQSNPEWDRGPKCYPLLKAMQDIHDNWSTDKWEEAFDLLIKQCDEKGNWVGK